MKANINSSLAPRHLRNYYYQLLTKEQFELVKKIVNSSWSDVELDSFNLIFEQNQLECFYKENGILREISWAGQGLQVWFQIITHLVLLLDRQIIILDEPEVNLHPEKQNELLSIFRQYHPGSVIIATHSIELMNNVNISHIININKKQGKPSIKIATDRKYLEEVRSNIGSNFNFVASQFEEVDYLIFTEDIEDYKIIRGIIDFSDIQLNDFNIPIHGFQQYASAIHYKNSYNHFLGKNPKCVVILDRDYYPEHYIDAIRDKLSKHNISLQLTSGKEIENIFISPELYKSILSNEDYLEYFEWLEDKVNEYKDEAFADYTGIYLKYSDSKNDENTIIKQAKKDFDKRWDDNKYNLVPGKKLLKDIRQHFQSKYKITLTNNYLIGLLSYKKDDTSLKFIYDIL